MAAFYTVDWRITLFLEEDEKQKMAGPDEPNFDLFTAFKVRTFWTTNLFAMSFKETLI